MASQPSDTAGEFQVFLSQVASRLRHDLKGGLITLKMGLESLPEEEALKPLLLEKSQELVELADKLVLLLRMGGMSRQRVRPQSLFQQAAGQAEDLYAPLQVRVESGEGLEEFWSVDPDAVTYAVLEICQNSQLAGAGEVVIRVAPGGAVFLSDNGSGGEVEAPMTLTRVGESRWGRGGLGLAVVQRCMEEHGGTLTLRPETDGFTVVLGFETGEAG